MLHRDASILFAFVLLAATGACSSSTSEPSTPSPSPSTTSPPAETPEGEGEKPPVTKAQPFSEAEVQQLFDERCTHCHDRDNTLLDLTAFAKTTVGVSAGAPAASRGMCRSSAQKVRIVRGDREASLLWHKVKGTQDCGAAMPYDRGNKPLDATELERLGLYIDGLR